MTQVKRDQKIPLIWFIANLGGILGLTMGMSLVTFFEILHYMVMILFRFSASMRQTKTAKALIPEHQVNTKEVCMMEEIGCSHEENNVLEVKEAKIQPRKQNITDSTIVGTTVAGSIFV